MGVSVITPITQASLRLRPMRTYAPAPGQDCCPSRAQAQVSARMAAVLGAAP
jgi:hypothetical protein